MFRISLRQLFILVAAVALAIVSLKYASIKWQMAIGLLVLMVVIAALIDSVVDRGSRQAFAIGFTIATLVYGLMIAKGATTNAAGPANRELDVYTYTGNLPTTQILGYIWSSVRQQQRVDSTGRPISDTDAARLDAEDRQAGRALRSGFTLVPQSTVFSVVGHCWFALLLGYLGGNFARFVYIRRMNERAASPTE